MSTPTAIVVMGVSGAGKSRVGEAIAARLGIPFLDADDEHTPAAREKMAAGIPLTDDDRMPWLRRLSQVLAVRTADGESVVLACSALRRVYRDVLRESSAPVVFVSLVGPPELLAERIGGRRDHFMPSSLLSSQLATLEPLQGDERGVEIDVHPPIDEVAATAIEALDRIAD